MTGFLDRQEMPLGTSLIQPAQVQSIVGFHRGSNTPMVCSHGKGALLHTDPLARAQLGRQSYVVTQPGIPQPALMGQCFSQQNKKKTKKKLFGSIFCQPTCIKQTNKSSIITQKGEANFSFLSQGKEIRNTW